MPVGLIASLDDVEHHETLLDAARTIKNAKKAIFVVGAGISTGAGADIPDFRGARGLFSAGQGQDVKELFHIKCLSSKELLPQHHALINSLADMSARAQPTAFHELMRAFDERGRLLRCYTQNIDGLEAKAGLESGLPHSMSRPLPAPSPSPTKPQSQSRAGPSTPRKTTHTPRCIPLHGLLTTLHCTLCSTTCPLSEHLPLPPHPLSCPTCSLDTALRIALNERQRQTGQLRASVVLYGESHPSGHLIGSALERDLRRVDLLVVAGTSLVIPGVKRMVKEISKAIRARTNGARGGARIVFVNHDPPPGEMETAFDLWIKGDVQRFVREWVGELGTWTPPTPRKTPVKAKAGVAVTPTKAKAELALTPTKSRPQEPVTPATPKAFKTGPSAVKSPESKRKLQPATATPKAAKVASYLPTPRETPPTRKREASLLDTPSKKPRRPRAYSTGSESSLTSLDDC